MIEPVAHVAAMSSYALAQLDPPVGRRLVSLSQNESLRPPSPLVAEAVSAASVTGHLYPDPSWAELRERLAKLHGIPAQGLLCGNGSMELIACLVQAYAGPDKAVLAPVHAYPFFRTAAQLVGARFDTAPETDGRVSVDALLAAVRVDTRILLVANPGNPTGSRLSRAELLRLRSGLRSDILLVIDEAYGEFADDLNQPMFDLVTRGDTVVLRTFSKAYGLAGFRVGWGLFPEHIASEVRKVMNPNNVSACSQTAATAALSDQAYMRETCALTASLRDQYGDRLRKAGLDIPESFTNFLLIRFADPAAAEGVDHALRKQGVFLRLQSGAGLANCLRATVGQADDLDLMSGLLERWAEEHYS